MNWNYLDRVMGSGKYFSLIFVLIFIMINVLFGLSNPIIDNWGHLGGLMCGFLLMFVLHRPIEENDGMCCTHKIWFWISLSFLLLLFVLGLSLFYTVRVTS